MEFRLSFLFLFFLISNSFAQINFEKGYFIDINNQRTECLIKNSDWANNPTEIKYKISSELEAKSADTSSMIEFGIYDISKFIRRKVKIDLSSPKIADLSSNFNPEFETRQLFLKVLIEGKASLFYYEGMGLRRYFYTIDSSKVEQLIFKEYFDKDNNICINSSFRNQLYTKVNCNNVSFNSVKNINYNKDDLFKYFKSYNECSQSKFTSYETQSKLDYLNLKGMAGFDYSSLSIDNGIGYNNYINFGHKYNLKIGLEAELIFPFKKSKWRLVVNPTFQYFNSETYFNRQNNLASDNRLASIKYKSIEMPIGPRYYMFLNKDTKIFLNFLYIIAYSINFNSKIYLDNYVLDLKSANSFAYGAGFEYKKASVEFRYYSNRNILNEYETWYSNYRRISFIVGYKLF